MINNMTDAWKTDLNLLIGQTLLLDNNVTTRILTEFVFLLVFTLDIML